MAKKKTTAKNQAMPARITLETVKTVFMRALENPARGVPTLIGPAQWGKTHYALQWMAEAGAKTVLPMNPQTDLPEDIAGWPVRSRNQLSFTNPSAIPPQYLKADAPPWGLFIDELDKAKEDTLSALLTLLNPGERRLRYTKVPPSVPICVAMNEPKRELPEPLVARLLFIPFPPEAFQMEHRILSSDLLSPPEVKIPERPHAPGSYFKLREWLSVPEFQQDEAVRIAVVSGLFPANVVPKLLEEVSGVDSTRLDNWAETCTAADLVENLYTVLSAIPTVDEADALLDKLRQRAEKDPSGEWGRHFIYAVAESDEVLDWRFPPLRKGEDGNSLPFDIEEEKERGRRMIKALKEININESETEE